MYSNDSSEAHQSRVKLQIEEVQHSFGVLLEPNKTLVKRLKRKDMLHHIEFKL